MSHEATRLYVLRHGEVDPRWRGRIYGCLDVDLSDEGRQQARWGARVLAGVKLDAVLTSTLRRARFSADLLARERGLDPVALYDLREIDRGEWAGSTFEELERTRPDALAAWHDAPHENRPPGGESLRDLLGRVEKTLSEALRELASRTVAVTAHAWVVRVLLCEALGLDLCHAQRLHVRTGAICAIEWSGGRATRLLGADLDSPLPN